MAIAPPVAVIGGGYAGMAAAVELARRGHAVTVFEAGRLPGGRARRLEQHGVALDNGLHILSGAYRDTLRLIALVNPQHGGALLRLPLAWHMHGACDLVAPRLPAPLHLLAALLTARGLRAGERLQMARFLLTLGRLRYRLDADTGVAALLAAHGQSERLCRVFWYPLCIAALNTPPAQASAQVFVNVLRDTLNAPRAASDLLLSRIDLSALFPEPAAAYVEARGGRVRTSVRVTGISIAGDGFDVQAGGAAERFGRVVCALPPHQAGACVAPLPGLAPTAALLAGFRYQPIYSVWLQFAAPLALPHPMLGFADGPLHWLFDRAALCGQPGLVGAVISAAGPHQDLAHDALGALALAELGRRLGPLPALRWLRVIAEKRATFACTPGLVRPANATPLAGFYLAGDYTAGDYPATLESAVRSGIACAAAIAGGG